MIENNALVNSASDLWQPTFFDILDDILSLCCFFGTPSIGVDKRHQYSKAEQINVKIEVSATQSNFKLFRAWSSLTNYHFHIIH